MPAPANNYPDGVKVGRDGSIRLKRLNWAAAYSVGELMSASAWLGRMAPNRRRDLRRIAARTERGRKPR